MIMMEEQPLKGHDNNNNNINHSKKNGNDCNMTNNETNDKEEEEEEESNHSYPNVIPASAASLSSSSSLTTTTATKTKTTLSTDLKHQMMIISNTSNNTVSLPTATIFEKKKNKEDDEEDNDTFFDCTMMTTTTTPTTTKASSYSTASSIVSTAGGMLLDTTANLTSTTLGTMTTQRKVWQARQENQDLHHVTHQRLVLLSRQLQSTNQMFLHNMTNLHSKLQSIQTQISNEFYKIRLETFQGNCKNLMDYLLCYSAAAENAAGENHENGNTAATAMDPHKVFDLAQQVDVSAGVLLSSSSSSLNNNNNSITTDGTFDIRNDPELIISIIEAKAFALGCKYQALPPKESTNNHHHPVLLDLQTLQMAMKQQIPIVIAKASLVQIATRTDTVHEILERYYKLQQWIHQQLQQQQQSQYRIESSLSSATTTLTSNHNNKSTSSDDSFNNNDNTNTFQDGLDWVREMNECLFENNNNDHKLGQAFVNQQIINSKMGAQKAQDALNTTFGCTNIRVGIPLGDLHGNKFTVVQYAKTNLGAYIMNRLYHSRRLFSKAFRYALQESYRVAETEEQIQYIFMEALEKGYIPQLQQQFMILQEQKASKKYTIDSDIEDVIDKERNTIQALLECISQKRWNDLSTCLDCRNNDNDNRNVDEDSDSKSNKQREQNEQEYSYSSLSALKRMADTIIMSSQVLKGYQSYGKFKDLRIQIAVCKSEYQLLELLKNRAANPKLLNKTIVENILQSVEEQKYYRLLQPDQFHCKYIVLDPKEEEGDDSSAESGWCVIS